MPVSHREQQLTEMLKHKESYFGSPLTKSSWRRINGWRLNRNRKNIIVAFKYSSWNNLDDSCHCSNSHVFRKHTFSRCHLPEQRRVAFNVATSPSFFTELRSESWANLDNGMWPVWLTVESSNCTIWMSTKLNRRNDWERIVLWEKKPEVCVHHGVHKNFEVDVNYDSLDAFRQQETSNQYSWKELSWSKRC